MKLWPSKKSLVDQQHELEERLNTEIPQNKAKEEEVAQEAVQAGEKLDRIVKENGFTLKIFQATGGKLKEAHR